MLNKCSSQAINKGNVMDAQEMQKIIDELKEYIDKVSSKNHVPGVMLRRSLNETWFSDTLAWLLDPKTEDNLGVDFINLFIRKIAEKRSDKKNNYNRRKAFLKFGKEGNGRSITGDSYFSFKNVAVMREYYLSKYDVTKKRSSAQFGDIVLFDLDAGDNIFLIIENKLFGTNHPEQLETYYNLVEEKYKKDVKVREYVYLTLTGEEPENYGTDKSDDEILKKNWIRMSWTDDILEILRQAKEQTKSEVPTDVIRFENILQLLKDIVKPRKNIENKVNLFTEQLMVSASKTLTEHLNRLRKTGNWEQKENIASSIKHTSVPKRVLYLQMMPNLALTVQGKAKSKAYYEKILIPFGTIPDQVYHLMYIAAKDIYRKHFSDIDIYKNTNKKLTKSRLKSEKEIYELLNFIYEYNHYLQVMLTITKMVKKANKVEEVRETYGEDEAEKTFQEVEPDKKIEE